MRGLKYIILTIFLVTACNTPKIVNVNYGSRAVYCLRAMLVGEDSGGEWQVVSEPVGSNIDTLLIGDNPCIQWTDQPCGQYELMYIVGDSCCRDTAIVRPLKCCLEIEISCE